MSVDFRKIEAIAFDLDGTLIDSAPDIQHALNAAMKKAGLERFDLNTVRSWIGDGPDVLIAHALARQGLADADAVFRARLRRWFDVATLAAPLSFGSVFAGIQPLVMALHKRLPMVVVSNKPTPLARAVLDAAQLLPFLHGVQGADTPALRKPAPAMLVEAAAGLGTPIDHLLMVGDGAADMNAARAAGCPSVLVEWGYGHHSLAGPEWAALVRIAEPAQLLRALAVTQRDTESLSNH